MLRVIAFLLMLAGVGLAGAGFFFFKMSGFASPPNKELVIVLSTVGMISGIIAIIGGVSVWRKSNRR